MQSPGSSERPHGTKVLVVDDSAAARQLISEILGEDPELEIVGGAVDGHEALEMVERLRPTVITMDLVMPRLDGLEAIRRIMDSHPTPIVVVATPQESNAWVFQAMEAGAVTVLEKPSGPGSPTFDRDARRLLSAVRVTAGVAVTRRRRSNGPGAPAVTDRQGVIRRRADRVDGRVDVVAIAASTGGPPALARILRELPADFGAPILVVQHIAAGFEHGLAQWLDEVAPLRVTVAGRGEALRAGEVLIAAPGLHLGIGAARSTTLSSSAPIDGFRPSATYMFRSVAATYGRRALAVVLTGLGCDGVAGLVDLKRAGGSVLVQDEETSVVYGMPRAAVAAGVADHVLALSDIPTAIVARCGGG
jgi:two-component system chemotaxis response regulator CheB